MNIGKEIKEQRNKLSLSQEELGERVYVTRQTISSWENGKSYPDINSLILLSQVFNVTIDNLIKGDLKVMEQKIEQTDIREMKKNRTFSIICMAMFLVFFPASWYLGFFLGIFISALIGAAAIYFCRKVEKIKCMYDVQTYREIVAFSKGETLDEITKLRESGKRKYQKVLYTLAAMVLGLLASQVIWLIVQLWVGGFCRYSNPIFRLFL